MDENNIYRTFISNMLLMIKMTTNRYEIKESIVSLVIGLVPLIIKNSLGFLMLSLFVIANNLSPIT
jgi:hypothetical protein